MISFGMRIPGTPIFVRDYLGRRAFRQQHRNPASGWNGWSALGAFVLGAALMFWLLR